MNTAFSIGLAQAARRCMLGAALAAGCVPRSADPAAPEARVHWTTIEGSKGAVAAIARHAGASPDQPVLFIGASWCGSCAAYKASLGDPRMVAAHRGVHILEVDAERHSRVVAELGVQPRGVPHWSELDATGHPTGRHIDGSAWTLNTTGAMASALDGFFLAR